MNLFYKLPDCLTGHDSVRLLSVDITGVCWCRRFSVVSVNADVSSWLKSLRLHKYSQLFQQLTYDEMLNLTDQWLESKVSRLFCHHRTSTVYFTCCHTPGMNLHCLMTNSGSSQNTCVYCSYHAFKLSITVHNVAALIINSLTDHRLQQFYSTALVSS